MSRLHLSSRGLRANVALLVVLVTMGTGSLALPRERTGLGAATTPVVAAPSRSAWTPDRSPLSPTPTPTPTPTPSRATPPTPAAVPLAEAVRIAIPEAKFSVGTRTLTVGRKGAIDPPDFDHVFRVADRGSQPGTHADNTVYFACHTHSRLTAAEVPCNALQHTVAVGQSIVVTTRTGKVTYAITQVRKVAKAGLASDREVWEISPGRLVWLTCVYAAGRTTAYNLVIFGELVTD